MRQGQTKCSVLCLKMVCVDAAEEGADTGCGKQMCAGLGHGVDGKLSFGLEVLESQNVSIRVRRTILNLRWVQDPPNHLQLAAGPMGSCTGPKGLGSRVGRPCMRQHAAASITVTLLQHSSVAW